MQFSLPLPLFFFFFLSFSTHTYNRVSRKHGCGQETRGYLYVRLREGIPRRWDLSQAERANYQKNRAVITALLFSRWRVIGRGIHVKQPCQPRMKRFVKLVFVDAKKNVENRNGVVCSVNYHQMEMRGSFERGGEPVVEIDNRGKKKSGPRCWMNYVFS